MHFGREMSSGAVLLSKGLCRMKYEKGSCSSFTRRKKITVAFFVRMRGPVLRRSFREFVDESFRDLKVNFVSTILARQHVLRMTSSTSSHLLTSD